MGSELFNNSVLRSIFECLLGNLVADAGFVGDFKPTVDGLGIIFRQPLVELHKVVAVMLVDDKVGDNSFKLQRNRSGQRTCAGVCLNADVIGVCHIANLADLGQTAAVADVGLDDLNAFLLKIRTILWITW